MKLFRLLLTFILSFILVSCDSIEKAINGDGRNFDFDGQSEVQEDGIYYADNNSEQPSKSNSSKKSFTVSFYDGDESLLDSDTFQYGTRPKYFGPKPSKKGSDNGQKNISYSFIGWSENKYDNDAIKTEKLPAVTKDTTYFAIFTTLTSYKVTFVNNGVELDSSYFKSGDKPSYGGNKLPEKSTTENYGKKIEYTFVGWNEDPDADESNAIKEEDLPPVTKTTVYSAIFSPTMFYEVVFFCEGNQLAPSFYVKNGEVPTYNGDELPTKDKTEKEGKITEYTFVGWSEDPKADSSKAIKTEDLPPITKETTYYALFSEVDTTLEYSINFYNGSTLLKGDTLRWGEYPSYSETPTKDSTFTSNNKVRTSYTFVGWGKDNPNTLPKDAIKTKDLPKVTSDATFYAIFSSTVSYLVSFYKDSELLTEPIYVENGKTPTYYGATPEKYSISSSGDPNYYSFVGWNTNQNASATSSSNITTLNKPITNYTTYYAIFKSVSASIEFNNASVELDCNDSTQSKFGVWPAYTVLDNLTYTPCLPKTATVTANITPKPSYFNIDWSLSEGDSSYFSLQVDSANPFSVNVTALKPSRLATLTAVITDKSTNKVVATKICQLRSVMTSVYFSKHYGYDAFKTRSIDVSLATNSKEAYDIRMFTPQGWGNDVDVVYPSKIKLSCSNNNNTFTYSDARAVCKISTIGNTDGFGPNTSTRVIRNLFIPNSVIEIENLYFQYIGQSNIIFEGGKSNIIYFQGNHKDFGSRLSSGYVKSFPFNQYATGTTFTSYSTLNSLADIFKNNQGIVGLFVRKS